ncbi:AcrR family transcriptional regulator [Parabacteroides sp. PM6-13]|uniref:TetR/AcrR family transcriptional regulator n=1 Tax=Parabacteroides sp. PM6-13 TaxID=1742408 RepID=UPI002475D957|nr:TetR/AcrR family transcriptional regulator [Parabacteroides sp. PM6-13]MDH6343456.1 AcrR family transcriptional regulator [Parabacteroides sp. PM6-13]
MKQQILSTALDLFSQYGIKRVSMDDITRNLGISKRTLYSVFSDKETLLLESITYTTDRMIDILNELEKSDCTAIDIVLLFHEEVMKRPRWYSKQFYEDLKKYPIAFEKREEDKTVFADRCLKLLNRGIGEGVIREGLNLEILSLLAKEQFKMTHPSKSFSHLSNTEVYNTVLITFLRGISTDKGNEILERWVRAKEFNKIIH